MVLVLLCAVAAAPLLRGESPCSHDGALHYYRVVAIRHALSQGVLFTRYLPDLAFGYGYPFFNYREPLPYYLALAFYLIGLPLPVALNLIYVLSIIGSALTAYLLARDLFGPRAGMVAAIAYAYAPYQFLDALLRANAPESVALPLFPLIMWAFRRLVLIGGRRWFVLSTGSLAALYLTHNISSLLFTPFLLAYLAMLWAVYPNRGGSGRRWLSVIAALVLAPGVTAFYLGPALLEQDYAQLYMSRVTRNNDFHYNFLSLAEIFAPPAPVDTSLLNPPMRVHLGLAQVTLGVLGLLRGLTCWRGREHREQKFTLVFMALGCLAMLWMSTSSSLPVWENIPLLPFVQFPWRLVGRAILPLALLAGALFGQHGDTAHPGLRMPDRALCAHQCPMALALCLLILAAFPYTYPPYGYCHEAPRPTITDVFAYERESGLVGVDPEGSYFPIWVKRRPEGSPLEAQYATGGPISRLDETSLPQGAHITRADYGPNRATIVLETDTPFRARYLAFYFPGWQVRIDGQSARVIPTDPEGLISFDVPAGLHTIHIRFGSTPVRTTCAVISVLGIAVLVLLWSRMHRYSADALPGGDARIRYGVLALVGLLMLALKLGVVDRRDTLFRHPVLRADGTLPGVASMLKQAYADGMLLIGYTREREAFPADEELRVDLYWTTCARPSANYQTVLHLVGADGLRWSLADTARPRGYASYPPNYSWLPGQYALDSHQVIPLPGAPPGVYNLVLTIFDRRTLLPLSVLNEQGQPVAPELSLGEVTLLPPRHPVTPARAEMREWLDIPLGPLTLLGATLDRETAAPGDGVLLTTLWQAREQPQEELTLRLLLADSEGKEAAAYLLPPTASWHPTTEWRTGQVWRGQHFLRLPAHLKGGEYRWKLELLPGGWRAELTQMLRVEEPQRLFEPWSVEIESGVCLGGLATLMGGDVEVSSGEMAVRLEWRAEGTAEASYHVFVHLVDGGGQLVRQSDGVPGGWRRPTTGWVAGEYVLDEHRLDVEGLPAGEYSVVVGLYEPGGARLRAADGRDAIVLTTVHLSSQPDDGAE